MLLLFRLVYTEVRCKKAVKLSADLCWPKARPSVGKVHRVEYERVSIALRGRVSMLRSAKANFT